MSIDNLPTETPLEASNYFSENLYPVVLKLANANFDAKVLKNARITMSDGTLSPQYSKLERHLKKFGGDGQYCFTDGENNGEKLQKSVVAGFRVCCWTPGRILVEKSIVFRDYWYLNLTIASNSQKEALTLSGGRSRTKVVDLNVNDSASLAKLIESHDVVVSFVPASMHPMVANLCVEYRKDMVTASYTSSTMKALNSRFLCIYIRAKTNGVTILNEIGLDPGIDHLVSMELFDHVKSNGGEINSYVSWCGGLPAPEASNVPLGYKFSWSPKDIQRFI
jgi:alpha-aminoadipic semialdehyde synthase